MSVKPIIKYFKSLLFGELGGALRYKYCGKEQDEETGLYYYGARYYLPWLCRFSSVDPKALKYAWQGSYCYAENNPIKLIDINGEGGGKPDYTKSIDTHKVQKHESDATHVETPKPEPVMTRNVTNQNFPVPSTKPIVLKSDKTVVIKVKPKPAMTHEQKEKLEIQKAAIEANKNRGTISLPSNDIRNSDFQYNNLNNFERVMINDPIIKAVAVGGAAIVTVPLFAGNTVERVSAAGADALLQIPTLQKPGDFNISSTVAAFAMPEKSFLSAGVGNFFEIKANTIGTEKVLQNTIFGDKSFEDALTGTAIDGTFNALGNGLGTKLKDARLNQNFSAPASELIGNEGATITKQIIQSYNNMFNSNENK